MVECSSCGVSDTHNRLFDVISSEGIVKLCKDCLTPGSVPLKKPSEEQINNIHKTESLYNRLSNVAGLDPEEHKKNIFGSKQSEEIKKQEVNLRVLIERNLAEKKKEEPVSKRTDLIDNFHWVIMRARRHKKMTITELAREIGERESFVKLAESGNIPEGDYNVIMKLEKVLGINILTPEIAERIANQKMQLGFDNTSSKELTIADLRERNPEKPKKVPYWKRLMFGSSAKKVEEPTEEELSNEDSVEFDDTSLEIEGKKVDKKDLSQGDIDDLIFGR